MCCKNKSNVIFELCDHPFFKSIYLPKATHNKCVISGVNISTSQDSDFLDTVDGDKFLKAENFSVLQCINDVVVPNITQCLDSVTPTTLVTPSRSLNI